MSKWNTRDRIIRQNSIALFSSKSAGTKLPVERNVLLSNRSDGVSNLAEAYDRGDEDRYYLWESYF